MARVEGGEGRVILDLSISAPYGPRPGVPVTPPGLLLFLYLDYPSVLQNNCLIHYYLLNTLLYLYNSSC
jgi:hypothetical protein